MPTTAGPATGIPTPATTNKVTGGLPPPGAVGSGAGARSHGPGAGTGGVGQPRSGANQELTAAATDRTEAIAQTSP